LQLPRQTLGIVKATQPINPKDFVFPESAQALILFFFFSSNAFS